MNYELVKLANLSGNEASVYSIWLDDYQTTSYDRFIKENINSFKSELSDINNRLYVIGSKTGAREEFFKPGEGNAGDGVCALYDSPQRKLRLYCIRYGTLIVIVGGGGEKKVRKLQDNEKLKDENYLLRRISAEIMKRIKSKEIRYSENKMDFEGNLIFNDDKDD
ncbi:MAG: hypothetical protein WAW07_08980 [Bacteroidales bacterium]